MAKPNPVPCPFCKPGNSYEIGAETVTLCPSLWQPIESAPRDSSDILVCRKGESPWLAWWHEPAMQWVRLRKESPDVQPTHWLPIPPMEEE